jgi:outer membrane protein insertion porin family
MRFTLLSIVASFTLFLTNVAYAETIRHIRVQGNERIEVETVLSLLTLHVGQAYSQEEADASLKALYNAGMFAHATITPEGDKIVVKVKENPMISKIAFEGNKRVKTDVLQKEMMLRPRMVLTQARVRQDTARIADIYRKSGRYAVQVTPKVIELPENRVNLIYEIAEGNKTPILKLFFAGNRQYPDSSLRDVVQSHEDRWYRFFSSASTFDQDRLEHDKMLLTRFYQSQGYADFAVRSVKSVLTPDNKGFYVTFTVEEGVSYNIASVEVESAISEVKVAELRSVITVKPKTLYNIEDIDESVDKLTDFLGDKGYAFTDVSPVLERDAEHNTIRLTFKVEEAPKVYIDKINITGNTRTHDKVIRREMAIAEGDPFNFSKIRRSKEKIDDLNYFKQAEVKPSQKDAADRVDLEVQVKEKATGSVTLAVGVSSMDGALATIGFNETNFLGRGQEVSASVGKSKYNFDLGFGFTQPYFMDTPLAAGFDVAHNSSRPRQGHRYYSQTDGLTLRGSYALTDRLQHTVFYTIQRMHFKNDGELITRLAIQEMLGRRIKSSVGQRLFYNRLNSSSNPTKGYFLTASQEFSGVGGNTHYLKHVAKAGLFVPFIKNRIVAQFTAGAGYIQALKGRTVLLDDRFQLGGDELRGFEYNGIGPRERLANGAWGEPIGGRLRYNMRAQLNLPTGLPEEYGVKWFPFIDAGSVLMPELSKGMARSDIISSSRMRISTGVGIGWASPLGSITISYGKALKKEKYDVTDTIQFSFGTSL